MEDQVISVWLSTFCLFFSDLPVIITPGLEQEDGWIIIQRRVDTSVSFERSWEEYAAGFGDVDGSFWLGLDAMNDLTTEQPMSLQIDVVLCNAPTVSIPYQQFHVGDAASEYRLTITSDTPGYNTKYTTMNYQSGNKFSTYDNDNHSNCGVRCRAGWWYHACCLVCLNGVYNGNESRSQMKMSYMNREPIRTATMKIKAIN